MGTALAGVLSILALAPSAPAAPPQWPFSAAGIANRSAAREDASALFDTLPLPPGVSPSTGQPPGTPPILESIGRKSSNVAGRTSWWTAPGEPKALTDWMREHPPAGIGWLGGGSAATFDSQESAWVAEFIWPPSRVLTHRALYAAASSGPAGTSIIRADALVTWLLPRPPQEHVPASAAFLEVVERRDSQGRIAAISRPTAVRKIASLINGFEAAQPKGRFCPKRASRDHLWLTFRHKEGGPVLAKASEGLPAIGCQALLLSVSGKTLLPLDEGQALYRAVRPMLAKPALHR